MSRTLPPSRRWRRTLTVAAISLGLVAPTYAAAAITVGSSGEVPQLQRSVGSGLKVHRYGKLSGPPITDVALVNIEPTVSWASIANGRHDADIKRWANALEGKGRKLVSFSHEPMSKANHWMGNARTFIAAWRHVVRVFDAQGARNVRWVWNVTSHSFRISRSSPDYGAKWYPGNRYADFVAGESYSRYKCGHSELFSFAHQIREILAFAKRHGKRMVVAEFAANAFAGRAQWIRSATRFVDRNRAHFRAVFYYNTIYGACRFKLSTSAEHRAIRNMINTL